ncbi:uncharacterized protein K02A2.6 [Trichonephila clavata]|uniref:RNA-directed DNA polymerase n=1 Tax=Trichonephila clavata TaxID=2740835 RepID=A0A8X6H0W9_TRICU|nr:uncharacterized protein K02A2.6 [Trichonephila clavata]
MDDDRITGSDDISHFTALEEFFKKCREHSLKLLNKSKFFQNEVNFLGHRIDSKGLHKTNEKISVVVNAPVPKNVHEVKSFFGLVNFYGKFCQNLAIIANPLNNMTKKKVRFLWSKDCQVAFEQIKKEIYSPKVLVHYDPNLPLILASDASPVGVGCVLSHVYPDGSERPIAFAELEVKEDITIFQMSQIEALHGTSKELRQETGKDIELGPLLKALRVGKDFQGREAQYTIEDGCIMYGQRICISKKFQKNVLEELHAEHLRIVKIKAIARSFVYWKNIDKDIEEAAKNCVDCARYKADPTKAKVHYWEYPSMPWERIHVDFAGTIFEHTFY